MPRAVRTVLIVGAGVMGSSIAQAFAMAGIDVRLVDAHEAALPRARTLIESGLETFAAAGKLAVGDIAAVMGRVVLSTDARAAAPGADFVLEAVPEDADLKRRVLTALDSQCAPDVVIASNTSSLDIFGLARYRHPERMVIAHFFAPAHIIPLVEVVPGPETSAAAVSYAVGLMRRIGKRPVALERFVPSFIVNRIQQAIGHAVEEILENGWARPEEVDRAVKLSLGVRLPVVGVVQTIDFTGLDVVRDILRSIGRDTSFFDGRVAVGELGVKTGRGMYDYGGRTEAEVLRKRDLLYLKMVDVLDELGAFDPV